MTSLFGFAAQNDQHYINRFEVHCPDFIQLRISLRTLITKLNETDNSTAKEYADCLRSIMSNWLTSPVAFDDSFTSLLNDMGTLETIQRQWGNVIHDAVSDSRAVLVNLQMNQNPLRVFVASQIVAMVADNIDFRIYCHQRSRIYFESIFTDYDIQRPCHNLFICSAASYRTLEPIDVLLKVGPFRSRGWGAVPDAIVSAPRSRSILQVLWSGSKDEEGFGYDPTTGDANLPAGEGYAHIASANWISNARYVFGNNRIDNQNLNAIDDFTSYLVPRQADDSHPVVLIQVDNDYGVLWPPLGKVLSFDENLVIEQRVVSESLEVGMFIVIAELFGNRNIGQRIGDGALSIVWRSRLALRYHEDPDSLVDKLRRAGISLASLHSCIQNWCRDPTTVIHAPMQRDHFKILIETLEVDFEDQEHRLNKWWEYAWDEVRRSRGLAIQNGQDAQQVVDQLLLVGLGMRHQELSTLSSTDKFTISIPPNIEGVTMDGQYRCFRIKSIEGGYRAPDRELRLLSELSRIDTWRE
jgi:hypothetical protein